MSEKNNIPPEITPGDRHPDYKGNWFRLCAYPRKTFFPS